jgi:chromosome segregation ATPase
MYIKVSSAHREDFNPSQTSTRTTTSQLVQINHFTVTLAVPHLSYFHPYIRPPETPNQLQKLVLLLIESAEIMSSQPRPQLHKSQPYQPISGNGTRLQPHSVDQDTPTIDQRLYSANSAISESLNILSSNRNTITSLTRAYTTYQQRLEEWSKAYIALEMEHKKTSTDLENMTRNRRSVSQQLKEAGRSYESTVQEYEIELQAALGHRPSQNMNQGEMREYQTAQAEANDKLTAAKQELNEMREIKRDYQNRLGEAHSQLDTCQQNLGKLHKEKEDLIRKHRDALGVAEDRAAIAKKRITELEKQESYVLKLKSR